MPYFDFSVEEQIDVDEFVSSCSSSEIKELIKVLVDDGHLPPSVNQTAPIGRGVGVAESMYEEALDKLHGNWNMLSSDEEELIIKISKRF